MLDYNRYKQVAIIRRKSLHQQAERTQQQLRFWKRLSLPVVLALFLWFGYALTTDVFSHVPIHEWQYILPMGMVLLLAARRHRLEERMQNLRSVDSRLARASDEMHYLERLLEGHQPFVLYLRDFQTGRARKQPIPPDDFTFCGLVNLVWPTSYGSRTATSVLDPTQHYFPTVLLDSDGDRTPLTNGLIAYTEEATWERDFQYLAEEAKYIVADFRLSEHAPVAPGIRKELSYLLEAQLRKVVVIGRAADLALLQAKWPLLFELSIFVCTLPDNFDREAEDPPLTDLHRFLAANYPVGDGSLTSNRGAGSVP